MDIFSDNMIRIGSIYFSNYYLFYYGKFSLYMIILQRLEIEVKYSVSKKFAFHTCLKNQQDSAKFGLVLLKELNLNEPFYFSSR